MSSSSMDTSLNSPPHDGGGSRKHSNDGSSRRRRALADAELPSSEGSPDPKQSMGDATKFKEPGYARKEDRRESDHNRYERGGFESHRHDRWYSRGDNYESKHDQYTRHEGDAFRSSHSLRGGHYSDRRRVETEHIRSRKDLDRHSRDTFRSSGYSNKSNEKGEDLSSGRSYTDSRLDDKGRDSQDEKKRTRWSFADHHGDAEIGKEKDIHVKYPRDRYDQRCNRDTQSKKRKLTHGNTNEESQTSTRLKPAPVTGNQDLVLQSHVNAAKGSAMQATELVNKNLVGRSYLTTDQKKKLLWGKKKSSAAEGSVYCWDSSLIGDRERQEKFKKLMGVKGNVVNQEQNQSEVKVEKQKELHMDLEKLYTAGLRRKDGRRVGLGL